MKTKIKGAVKGAIKWVRKKGRLYCPLCGAPSLHDFSSLGGRSRSPAKMKAIRENLKKAMAARFPKSPKWNPGRKKTKKVKVKVKVAKKPVAKKAKRVQKIADGSRPSKPLICRQCETVIGDAVQPVFVRDERSHRRQAYHPECAPQPIAEGSPS